MRLGRSRKHDAEVEAQASTPDRIRSSVGGCAFYGFSGAFNGSASGISCTFCSGIDGFADGSSGISGGITCGGSGVTCCIHRFTSGVSGLSTCVSSGIDCTFRRSGSGITRGGSGFASGGGGVTSSVGSFGGSSGSLRGFLFGFLGARANQQREHGNRQSFEHRVECFHEHLRFGRRKNN